VCFCLTVAAAQEPGMRRPATGGLPPAGSAPGQEARGIEKKDIRAIIVYPDGVYGPGEVQRFEAAVSGVVDAIASGAKLTKADAARSANPGAGDALEQQISQQLRAGHRIIYLKLTALPASAGYKPIPCPPENCGCGPNTSNIQGCSCSLWREFCYCLLCYTPTVLTPFKEEDPVLDTLIIKGRMQGPAGASRPDGLLVVVVTPPEAGRETVFRLAQSAIESVKSEPWPARVTIKVKSSPR
ncbi:MAG: hypothetical protein ACPL7M_08275, partial [Bryobacteraceae bacterium]